MASVENSFRSHHRLPDHGPEPVLNDYGVGFERGGEIEMPEFLFQIYLGHVDLLELRIIGGISGGMKE
jgi:hypothetical protein